MKKKFALIGLVAVSAMMIGCSSTQCRDGDTCAEKTACCGNCADGEAKGQCCGTCAGDKHAHSHGEKKACGPDCAKPCCAS